MNQGPERNEHQDLFDVIKGCKDFLKRVKSQQIYRHDPSSDMVLVDALKNKKVQKPKSLWGFVPVIINSFVQNFTSILNVILGRVQKPEIQDQLNNLNQVADAVDRSSHSLTGLLGGIMQAFCPGFTANKAGITNVLNNFASPSMTAEDARRHYAQRQQ